jgi:SHS2 domain-containing protein
VGDYRVLEDVALADCALEIDGRDPDDLFATAARALAEIMVDPATLRLTVARAVALEAAGIDLLLYDWLSELIWRKDRDREVFPQATVRVSGGGPWRLRADLRGGVLEPARTALRADAKAVTLHQFAVTARPGGWRARVVIDI